MMSPIFQGFPTDEPLTPKRTRLQEFWRIFRQNRLAIAGLVIFVLFFFFALLGLFLTSGQDPLFDPALVRLQEKLRPPLAKPNLETLMPGEGPSLGVYLFGTDDLGRDVFSRMLQGAWVSLTVGFVAVGIAVFIGIIMGGISGYFGQTRMRADLLVVTCIMLAGMAFFAGGAARLGGGLLVAGHACLFLLFFLKRKWAKASRPKWFRPFGWGAISIDTLIMRLVDIMLCFPSFFLILTVVALLPASIYNIMIVIGLTSWMGAARFVRAEFLSLRELDFVTAARALGISNFRIVFRHMMPNAIAPVLVSATIGIATAILTEAGLSFLGFGVPPPHATWGNILSDGKRFIFDAPWLTFIPGFAILVVVLCFNLFGEGLRDALNPRLKERH
ncbi:MAG: ABC transporter permease [Deltaproteobacteria bacterium]|nr:ABC transporter permease [Deltaproteobacteria bacterium]